MHGGSDCADWTRYCGAEHGRCLSNGDGLDFYWE